MDRRKHRQDNPGQTNPAPSSVHCEHLSLLSQLHLQSNRQYEPPRPCPAVPAAAAAAAAVAIPTSPPSDMASAAPDAGVDVDVDVNVVNVNVLMLTNWPSDGTPSCPVLRLCRRSVGVKVFVIEKIMAQNLIVHDVVILSVFQNNNTIVQKLN